MRYRYHLLTFRVLNYESRSAQFLHALLRKLGTPYRIAISIRRQRQFQGPARISCRRPSRKSNSKSGASSVCARVEAERGRLGLTLSVQAMLRGN